MPLHRRGAEDAEKTRRSRKRGRRGEVEEGIRRDEDQFPLTPCPPVSLSLFPSAIPPHPPVSLSLFPSAIPPRPPVSLSLFPSAIPPHPPVSLSLFPSAIPPRPLRLCGEAIFRKTPFGYSGVSISSVYSPLSLK